MRSENMVKIALNGVRLPRFEPVNGKFQFQSATDVLPMAVGTFAFRYQGNGGNLCQYIGST